MINYAPYTNFQDTNLDWILGQIQNIPNMIAEQINTAIFRAYYDPTTETLILDAVEEKINVS